MSEFSIRGDEARTFDVWIQLEEGDPTEQGESFIIGQGLTREAAIDDAIQQLTYDMAKLNLLREPVTS